MMRLRSAAGSALLKGPDKSGPKEGLAVSNGDAGDDAVRVEERTKRLAQELNLSRAIPIATRWIRMA